jgi:NADH:ubiquinone reductase (H+-translocating)
MGKMEEKLREPRPGKPLVVIIGAGFGGLEAAKCLKGKDVEVLLIDRNNYHLFQPLLYQVATAGLEPNAIAYPVRAILRGAKNIHFRVAEVYRIDRPKKTLSTSIGPIGYDYLLVSAGNRTNFFGNQKLSENCFELKSLNDAIDLRNHVLTCFEKALAEKELEKRRSYKTIVIVGGGPTGVELAGAYAELARHVLTKDFPMLDLSQVSIILLESGNSLLAAFPETLRGETFSKLIELGVDVRLNSAVAGVENGTVLMKTGETIKAETVIWAAGVQGVNLSDGLTDKPAKGSRVPVTPQLHLLDGKNVFVIGDLALASPDDPLMAPVAIQQARCAANNIMNSIQGKSLVIFRYKNRGMMATIGRKAAVATIYGSNFRGLMAWLIWLLIHILWLIGFRNKLIVLIDWAYNYFTYERGVRLITRKPKTNRLPELER